MIIDLSLPFSHSMMVFPGDPSTEIIQSHSILSDGYSLHKVIFGSHTGTHVDAPCHYDPSGSSVDEISVLDACVGNALVVDVRKHIVDNTIEPSSLGDALDRLSDCKRVLLVTGWSEHYGTPGYYTAYPSISGDLADLFVACGIRLVGLETPSLSLVDDTAIHQTLLGNGVVVVESLVNLTSLPNDTVFFSAAPLKLTGLDGSPVRAYAVIE